MNSFILVLKGFLIGIANVIPGVSGGTFALILGIFSKLMDAISSIGPRTFRLALFLPLRFYSAQYWQEVREEWKRIHGTFLSLLALGAVGAILASTWIISYLLEHHPEKTLAFFIGLILPSLAIPYRMMSEKRWYHLFWLLLGAALTVGVALLLAKSSVGSKNLLWAFLSGSLAISAMILPGISGSFVLLVLGQYQNVIYAVKELQRNPTDLANLLFLSTFALGCLLGLLFFARLLKFLLERYPSATMAFLIGLIVGSLWVLWPFKDYERGLNVRGKKSIQIASAPNRLPHSAREGGVCLASFLIGFGGAFGLSRLDKRETPDG